jgi:hypothetical protein
VDLLVNEGKRSFNIKTSYFTKIVGTTFEGRQDVIASLKGDETIRLRREPDNQYDPNAVAVDVKLKDWTPIGYISKDNSDISTLLDKGKKVEITLSSITGGGDKNFGINIEVKHDKLKRPPKRKIDYEGTLKPEILSHPNIPKPLHGIAPRTIKGQKWWDVTRKKVYESTDFHCIACGVSKKNARRHQWLEAHEYWDVDYEKGITTVSQIVPLCHFCHNFSHSGRLSMIVDKEKPKKEVIDILEHGFSVLADNKLECFPITLELAESLGAETFGVTAYKHPDTNVPWHGWKLIFEGKEYKSKFKNYEDWQEHYNKLNEEKQNGQN